MSAPEETLARSGGTAPRGGGAPAAAPSAGLVVPPDGPIAAGSAPGQSAAAAGSDPSDRPARRAGLFYAASRLQRLPADPQVLARRRRLVALLKRVLPAAALMMLAAITLWPHFNSQDERLRFALPRVGAASGPDAAEAARLVQPRYAGVDAQNRPFVLTAAAAQQGVGSDRIDLDHPQGEIRLGDGRRVTLDSERGIYRQQAALIELGGAVTLRQEIGGTAGVYVLNTTEAAIDLRAGAAGGDAPVFMEGPAGTLDAASGFRLYQRGAVILFLGPARALLTPAAAGQDATGPAAAADQPPPQAVLAPAAAPAALAPAPAVAPAAPPPLPTPPVPPRGGRS